MCFLFICEQTATCATYIINWLVFITEMRIVYSAVRTGSLNKTVCASSLKGCSEYKNWTHSRMKIMSKGRYTLSVNMSDFTVWSHTWRKNWVNCAVLTGNSAGLRTVLSSRLSHRELLISLRESHTHSIHFSVQVLHI